MHFAGTKEALKKGRRQGEGYLDKTMPQDKEVGITLQRIVTVLGLECAVPTTQLMLTYSKLDQLRVSGVQMTTNYWKGNPTHPIIA